MASTSTRKRSKKKGKKADAPLIPTQRKKEVLGLILMALALLVSLALITYDPADDPLARNLSLSDALLNPSQHQAQYRVQNALGLVGAEMARVLVPGFLGYTVLLLTGLVAAWGFTIFRHRQALYLPLFTVLGGVAAFVVSSLFGWFAQVLNADLLLWAGAIGMGVAGWMQRIFGSAGSLILLLLMASVTLLLALDHDIQRSLDRLAEWTQAIRNRITAWWAQVQERHAERKAARAERRAERQAELERRREERERKRAEQAQQEAEAKREAEAKEARQKKNRPQQQQTAADATAPATGSARTNSTSRPPSPVPPEARRTPMQDESTDSEAAPDDASVRRNDLFRSGSHFPPQDRSTPSSPKPPSSSAQPPSLPEDEDEYVLRDFDMGDDADDESDTGNSQTDDAESTDVELKVQEQIEEEKADDIERPAEVPDEIEYTPPAIDLLDPAEDDDPSIDMDELEANKQILLDKLATYDIEIRDIKAVVGPTVTRYELTPAPGIKVSRIKSLEDDLAMAMAAQGIRMIAPIPGKSAVGVEIPNRHRELVRLRDVIGTAKFRDTDMELPIPLGKSIEGEVFLADLTKMPHLLIAGATGSGKSVGLNTLIMGLIYACHPANLKFVIIDPKKIELQQYAQLDEHFMAKPDGVEDAVITDVDMALGILKSCEREMEQRYDLLSAASVRGIRAYNKKFQSGALEPEDGHRHMPYIVVVVDELADLMMTAGKEIEGPIARLAQMARAVGIHLVLATQRPSVDVITGLIKANFPSRIAYEVASRVDSRTILDQIGAEGLVGNGDLLYLSGSRLVRLQGPFVSVEEVERINAFIAHQQGVGHYRLPSLEDAGFGPDVTLGVEDTDDLFEEGARVIVRRQQGSVSLLQRKLSVGYTRAARIVDQLEEAGIVGPFAGTKAREVLVDSVEDLERLLAQDDGDEEANASDNGPA